MTKSIRGILKTHTKKKNSLVAGVAGSEFDLWAKRAILRKEICRTFHVPCACIYISFLFGAIWLRPTQPHPIINGLACMSTYVGRPPPLKHKHGRSNEHMGSRIQDYSIHGIHVRMKSMNIRPSARPGYTTYIPMMGGSHLNHPICMAHDMYVWYQTYRRAMCTSCARKLLKCIAM